MSNVTIFPKVRFKNSSWVLDGSLKNIIVLDTFAKIKKKVVMMDEFIKMGSQPMAKMLVKI